MAKSLLLFIMISFMGLHQAFAEVWSHQPARVWNEEWETKYSLWFEKNVAISWLQQPGFVFTNWSVDCAKFPFLTRLYFSYENNLEFAIVNSNEHNKIISSLSSHWDQVPAGPLRLQAFAKEVLNRISTSTLPENTVLVSISPASIRSGAILAGDSERRHTWVIQKINPSGIPQLIYGTLPGSDFLYLAYTFPPSQSAFPLGKLPTNNSGGIRRFKWPQDLLKDSKLIPYASLDQTNTGILAYDNFFEQIQSKIKKTAKDPNEEFGYMLDDLCMKVRARVNVIIDAGQAVVKKGNRPFTEQEIDFFSTPKRDQDILLTIKKINTSYSAWLNKVSKENLKRYDSLLHPEWTTGDECLVSWANNRTEPLGAILQRFQSGLISSKAADSFSNRWGEF